VSDKPEDPAPSSPPPSSSPPSEAQAPSADAVVVESRAQRWRRRIAAPFRYGVAVTRRMNLKLLLFRVVVYGVTAIALLAFLTWAAVKIFVTPDVLKKLIVEQAATQTGGRLDIAAVTFDPLRGVKLEGVAFFPPLASDPRGVNAGGPVTESPLAELQAVEVSYSIPRLLAAKIHLNKMRLDGPRAHLRRIDGAWNFDGIMRYRAVAFPDESSEVSIGNLRRQDEIAVAELEEILASAEPDEPAKPLEIPAIPAALLYMPIEILVKDLGVHDFKLDLQAEEGGKPAQAVTLEGLNFDVGLHWFGRTSTFWFNMLSPFERPLVVEVKDAPRDAEGKVVGELKRTLAVRTASSIRFGFDDFKRIGVDVATRLMNLETAVAGYQDIGAITRVRLVLADDYRGVTVDALDVDLADALLYELRGVISLPDGTTEQIAMKLKQKFNLDLAAAALLAKPFVPELKADGQINFDDFRIDGMIEPAKLAELATTAPLPYVSGTIWLEDVYASYPGTGVRMEPLSGDISIAAGPALGGAGTQVDLAVDMDIPMVEATQPGPAGEVTAGVDDMAVKVTARALWPEMEAPVVKVNVEAEHVRAKGKNLATLDVPLFVDVDADGRGDLARGAVAATFELTDLAELTVMADCQARCSRLRSNVMARLESLEKIHAMALPLGGILELGDAMPKKLTGALDLQASARGRMPDPLVTPVPQLLKEADVRFNAQLNLAKVSAQVPLFKVDLKNFETRLNASGSLAQQKVDLTQKFESLSLTVPPAPVDPKAPPPPPDAKPPQPMAVAVNRWDIGVTVDNQIEGPLDLETVTKQLATDVEGWVYVGKTDVPGVLPRPISDFQLEYEVGQRHLEEFRVKDVEVRLSDFGTTVNVKADTKVAPDFFPERLGTEVTATVIHNGGEGLPGGIKTNGRVDFRLAVASDDMRTVAIDGATGFDRFFVTIPGEKEDDPAKLVVEDIRGEIPFKQTIKIPDVKAMMAAKAAAQPVPAAAPAPSGAAPAPSGAAPAASASPAPTAPSAAPAVDEVLNIAENAGAAGDGDDAAAKDEKLFAAMDKYFEKNEDKLLANTNVTAIVDYGSVRPFYPQRKPLSIKRLEAANLELSRMEFDMELRQNWFALNQFVIGFLGGKIQGDFQFAFDSAALASEKPNFMEIPKKLRTSVHLTRLDTRKLIERFPNLKGKANQSNLFSNPYIDGTVHLALDVKTSDLSGGVEITSIGKDQLRMMLYYVDPFEQNPTIADIRKALAFGDVRQVSIPLKNGEVGMDVDVRVLGAPLPTPKLSRFPISQILQNFKDQAAKDAAAGGAPEAPAATGAPPAATPPTVPPPVSG
jgi:hypothetical protein